MNLSRNVIELLAPAKNAECARAAIDHGADAVYMGAPQFGARKAAANTLDDVASVADYAHLYGARLHVTLNTLLFDHEVSAAKNLAWQLYEAGADVLIVQDAALLGGGMPPVEMHASTQCDNRAAEKVLFWQNIGLRQAVLARELSLDEITAIGRQTTIRLEAFVHGALCVGYSGQCYMSLCDGGRSANRGECAQPCRLAYDLLGADGTVLRRKSHVLSLKDNNQTRNLEAMIDAGVSSFKIEGRLKDAGYVSNITLHYRQALDEILARRPDLTRLSKGTVVPGFEPNPLKSFNRGFTTYFANGRQPDIWQPLSPKSFGEPVGEARQCKTDNTFRVASGVDLHNGDGLCYVGRKGTVYGGLKVNTVQQVAGKGGKPEQLICAQHLNGLHDGDRLFRNSDLSFDNVLKHDKTQRLLDLRLSLSYADGTFSLRATDEEGTEVLVSEAINSDAAQNPDKAADALRRTLGKLGGTAFRATQIDVSADAGARFAAAADINALRRRAVEELAAARIAKNKPEDAPLPKSDAPYITTELARNANVLNKEAEAFYAAHGAKMLEWGYERQPDHVGQLVMTTRHCLMNAMGMCLKKHPEARKYAPLTLIKENGQEFEARMNCAKCQMEIFLREKRKR